MRPRAVSGERVTPLRAGWRLATTDPGACGTPGDATALADWIAAEAPGTTAGALRRAGRPFDGLHGRDVWWRLDLPFQAGPRRLRFDGLATLCEAWLDDAPLFRSASMFLPREAEVELRGGETLWLAFRALEPEFALRTTRARWRTRITPRQGLRRVRTTLAGQMPGWQPAADAVGPWREVSLVERGSLRVGEVDLRAGWSPDGGRLEVRAAVDGADALTLRCAGRAEPMRRDDGGLWTGALDLPGVTPWRPRTHGEPALHQVTLRTPDGRAVDLGATGFRSVQVDHGADGRGFSLVVNGEPVFCRGANWTGAGVVDLPASREAYAPFLSRAAQAGMNMIRAPGVHLYEAEPFFDLCDELGLLVWQDFAFANFDYPAADPAFAALARAEAEAFLRRTQAHPSLAILCGGSEIAQQAAMMGLPEAARTFPLCDELLAEVAAELRPDLPYVPHSPGGGALPFSADEGVAHFYGVGAYRLPLSDARRAKVRFAAECLAFSNPPAAGDSSEDPPRDVGADWNFADVRDHYLRELYGEDPTLLLARDPALYADLSRAVPGEVMEPVFAEWRRPGSPCRGGLVWTLADVRPGAGWGVLDERGEPKPAWYALHRAFRAVQLAITDEGANGLALHLLNDTGEAVEAELELLALAEGARPVVRAGRPVRLEPRSGVTLNAWEVLGAFYDFGYVHRFGPPAHDAVVARLRRSGGGEVLAEAFHFPLGRRRPRPAPNVAATLERGAGGWTLALETDRLAETVWVRAPAFLPDDDGFHLAPGACKRVRLEPRSGVCAGVEPSGKVVACGGAVLARFGSAA